MNAAARIGKPSFSFNCERCDHEPDNSHFRWWREAVTRLYRDLTGCDGAYANDATGRAFLLALAVAKLPRSVARRRAPWMPQGDLDALYAKAARIPPTMANVSEIIHLTRAQVERYGWRLKNGMRVMAGIGLFPPCDPAPDVPFDMAAWLKRDEGRNEKQKARRRKKQAELLAECAGQKGEAAVLGLQRIGRRPGGHTDLDWSMSNLKLTIEDMPGRAAFPLSAAGFHRELHRTVVRLAERGVVTKTPILGSLCVQVRLPITAVPTVPGVSPEMRRGTVAQALDMPDVSWILTPDFCDAFARKHSQRSPETGTAVSRVCEAVATPPAAASLSSAATLDGPCCGDGAAHVHDEAAIDTLDVQCPGGDDVGHSEGLTVSASLPCGPAPVCEGAAGVGEEQNPQSTHGHGLELPAAPLPCEDGHSMPADEATGTRHGGAGVGEEQSPSSTWTCLTQTSGKPVAKEATGIRLDLIDFQRAVRASPARWRVPMASPQRLAARQELMRLGRRIAGLLAWLADHHLRAHLAGLIGGKGT